jgi:hypothetical protein
MYIMCICSTRRLMLRRTTRSHSTGSTSNDIARTNHNLNLSPFLRTYTYGRENERALTRTRAHLCLVIIVRLRVQLGRTMIRQSTFGRWTRQGIATNLFNTGSVLSRRLIYVERWSAPPSVAPMSPGLPACLSACAWAARVRPVRWRGVLRAFILSIAVLSSERERSLAAIAF